MSSRDWKHSDRQNHFCDVIVGIDTTNRARKWLSINTYPIFHDDQLAR